MCQLRSWVQAQFANLASKRFPKTSLGTTDTIERRGYSNQSITSASKGSRRGDRLALSLHPNDSRWNHAVSKAQEVERERLGVYLCRKHCQPIGRNDGRFQENSLGLSYSPCSKTGNL